MINPQSEHRTHQALRITIVIAMLGVLAWGLMPIREEAVGTVKLPKETPQQPMTQSDPDAAIVTADAFDLTLWYMPPVANKTNAKPRNQTRVVFELLAVSGTNDDSPYSVIYDPQDDSIHTLSIGESIRGYTVSEIQSDSISLTTGSKTLRLALDSEEAG